MPAAAKPKRSASADVHRALPASTDAEMGVLCSFLLAPREVGGLCAELGVTAETFHTPAHGTIYGVLVEMWDANLPIDIVTLTQTLHDRNLLESVGGGGFVAGLFTFLPTATNARYYVEILREKSTLRQIIQVGTTFASRCYEEQENVAGLLDENEAALMKIAQARHQAKAVTIKQQALEAITSIEQLYERRGAISGLSTGFVALDKMCDGLHPGEMIVIAARPSMGKTALCMGIAEHVAVDCQKPVAVFSLEMSSQQLVQRLLASRARIDMSNIRKGLLAEREFHSLTVAASKIAESKLFIDDTAGLTILELRAKARRLKLKHDVQAIFIDYLQLLRSATKRAQENRQLEIAEISSGLKALSKELELPIVVLAQLNRNPEQRAGESKGRPRLSDLRESGSIEQDADLVGLLVRDEYYAESDAEREQLAGRATLIIAKQRNGPVGDVPFTFLKQFTRFEDRHEEAA